MFGVKSIFPAFLCQLYCDIMKLKYGVSLKHAFSSIPPLEQKTLTLDIIFP